MPLAVAFMLGIFTYPFLPIWPVVWISLFGLTTALAIAFFRRPSISSIILLLATTLAGASAAQLEAFYYPVQHISSFTTDQPQLAQLELRLTYPPRDLTWQYGSSRALPPRQVVTATVTRLKTWTGWIDCGGDILVQIGQPHPRLRQGQIVQTLGFLQRPGEAMNPGQFNWAEYYRDQRVIGSLQIAQADSITILDQGGMSWVQWLREQTRRALARGFAINDSLDHALLRALMLGDNDPELRDVQEQFRRTGTSHHLAISGMHVAVLGAVVFGICRLLRIGPRAACWISLIFIVTYGVVALPSPPVVRSVVLCACFAIGILQRRSIDLIQLLSVSVLAMLVYDPLDLYNAGFQLSFGMVLGLAIFTPRLATLLPGPDLDEQIAHRAQPPGSFAELRWKLMQQLRAVIAASIVAWVIAMPLIAYHFEQLNPWAIPFSLILAPFVFIALIGGFAKVLLTLLLPSAAEIWSAVAVRPVAWMRGMVDWLATLPGADVPFPAPPVWMVLLYYALLLAMLVPMPQIALRWSARTVSLAGCMMLAIIPLRNGVAMMNARMGELKVTLLAIGAGQCCVIEPPGALPVLVDAGSMGMSDVLHKVLGPFLRRQGQRDIGSIFISHSNTDHFSAVSDIATAYEVPDIHVSPQFRRHSIDNAPAEGLLRALDQLDTPPRQVQIGRKFDLGAGALLEVLWPPAESQFDSNNCSLVMRLTFAGRSVLFTGDIQSAAQRELMQLPDQLKSDVLVAPHHGSFESTTTAFIDAVSPSAIVCSNDRTLSVRQKQFDQATAGRNVLRTHTSGAITIRISKNGDLNVEPHLTGAK